MDIYALVLTGAALVLIWLILKPKRRYSSSKHASHETPRHGQYAGVSIIPCKQACQVACSTKSKAYLLKDSPHLPLNGCDKHAECTCHFIHLEDRRRNEDRRAMTIVMKDIYHGMERRSIKRFGRRRTDYIEMGA
jgi:hypothetical protein